MRFKDIIYDSAKNFSLYEAHYSTEEEKSNFWDKSKALLVDILF